MSANDLIEKLVDVGMPKYMSAVNQVRDMSFSYRAGPAAPGRDYYEVPREYRASTYRYTAVNNRTVLVDPDTGRIVQVID